MLICTVFSTLRNSVLGFFIPHSSYGTMNLVWASTPVFFTTIGNVSVRSWVPPWIAKVPATCTVEDSCPATYPLTCLGVNTISG
jgi:hypothetical protein